MKAKKYFEITTKRVALLAMLLVLNILCELISQYILVLGKIGPFLTFSVTFWTILVCYLSINGFYAFIFLEITTWLRVGMSGDPIGGIGLNLSDLSFLIVFMVVVFVGNLIRKKFLKDKNEKWNYFAVLMVAMTIATFTTAGLDVAYNKYFLIDMYKKSIGNVPWDITKGLLITIFWFNLAEYAINIAIFSAIYSPTYLLAKRYNA